MVFQKGHKAYNKIEFGNKEVIKMYLDDKKSTIQIARILECSPNTIYNFLKNNNISTTRELDLDLEKIKDLYLGKRNIEEIANMLNVSKSVIYLRLKKLNLTRKKSDALIGRKLNFKHRENISNSKKGKPLLKKRKILDENKIVGMYSNQKKSSYEIAKIFNCSDVFIRNILKKNNINRRSISEANKGKYNSPETGFKKGHKSWNDGIKIDRSKYPNMGHFEKHREESKEKNKLKHIKLWQDQNSFYHNKNYQEKRAKASIKGLIKRPTSFEKKIAKLCIENSLPFIYTGNGQFLINFKNPDFVNEKNKVVIEVFYSWFKIRDYGSVENYKKFCKEKYNSAGWKVIFIDENEVDVDNWKELCLNKIKELTP